MPSDYLSGIQVGAQVGNMMAQRQERLIELRAQAAQQQIHERYVAAQVDQLNSQIMENAQKLKEQQDKSLLDDATRAAAPGLYNKNLMETFDGESVDHEGAMRKTIGLISLTNPDVAKEMATAFKSTQADPVEAARIRAAQSGANVAAQQAGAAQRTQSQQEGALARAKLHSPHLDAFTQSLNDYQNALQEGNDQKATLLKARLQKLSGQLPSAALREGEDLATTKEKLGALTQKMNNLPEVDPADEAQRQHLQAVVDSMESRHGQEEISVSTPGGPEVRITKGGKEQPGAVTKTETTKYGEDVQATSNALRNLTRLRDQLGSGVVGAAPTVENFLYDKVLSQFGADVTDKARIAGRQNIRLATQQVLGELNSKGRFSNQELTAIKEAMPSLGMAESAPNARVNLDQLMITLAEKGAAAALAIKRPVSPEILQALAQVFPPGAEGERAMAAEVRNGALNANVALQVRKWQKTRGK